VTTLTIAGQSQIVHTYITPSGQPCNTNVQSVMYYI